MHRNYPNYHVNGILRATRCVFVRYTRLLATAIYAREIQPADMRVRDMLVFKDRSEIHTYLYTCILYTTYESFVQALPLAAPDE